MTKDQKIIKSALWCNCDICGSDFIVFSNMSHRCPECGGPSSIMWGKAEINVKFVPESKIDGSD